MPVYLRIGSSVQELQFCSNLQNVEFRKILPSSIDFAIDVNTVSAVDLRCAFCMKGYRVCAAGQIRCQSGQCIGEAQFCAGLITCADNSVYIDDNVCR